MFGDILSDEASEISGSLGLAGSVMAGDDACCAQAQHGSAPDIAGQDKANPTSLLLSAAMLLGWLAERHKKSEFDEAARAIESTIDRALQSPATRTPDLGGTLGTKAFAKHAEPRQEVLVPAPRTGVRAVNEEKWLARAAILRYMRENLERHRVGSSSRLNAKPRRYPRR